MDKNNLKQEDLLAKGYGMIPKLVMKDAKLSVEAKAIYAYLCSYCGAGDTAFPAIDLICHDLTISEKRFQRHMKQLKDSNYVRIERKRTENGFSNNIYTLPKTVSVQNVPVQSVRVQGVPVQNVPTNSNSLKSNSLKSNIDNKNHMSSKPDPIPYSDIINYLNEKADKSFKTTTAQHRKLIKARWNEGFRFDDFKKVIDLKVNEWTGVTFGNGQPGENYLKPSTLFSGNFDEYLSQESKKDKQEKRSESNSTVVF